jgi:hypothetical protein
MPQQRPLDALEALIVPVVVFFFFYFPEKLSTSRVLIVFRAVCGRVFLSGLVRVFLSLVREIKAPGTALMVPGAFFCSFGGRHGNEVICGKSFL